MAGKDGLGRERKKEVMSKEGGYEAGEKGDKRREEKAKHETGKKGDKRRGEGKRTQKRRQETGRKQDKTQEKKKEGMRFCRKEKKMRQVRERGHEAGKRKRR